MSSLDGDKIEGDDEGRQKASNVDTSNDIFDFRICINVRIIL